MHDLQRRSALQRLTWALAAPPLAAALGACAIGRGATDSAASSQEKQVEMFKLRRLSSHSYALIGELGQRSPANLGNNMTCGFIVGDDAICLIDTGGSKLGAQAIARAVRSVSNKPIRWAVNTGGQDHRWFGNAYFRQQHGTKIFAAQACIEDQKARGFDQMTALRQLLGDRAVAGTDMEQADLAFTNKLDLALGGVQAQLIYSGGAHTPGDSWVWLPQERTLFAGDTVYTQRLLGLQPKLGLRWIAALERLRDELAPVRIVPGHGDVADLKTAMQDSLGYLRMLRDGSRRLIEAGAFDPLEISEKLDQSVFSHLENYAEGRFRRLNAYRMAEELL